ncbi:hypothetical protein AKJ37_07340 [candidate division MSBL1 archaeon SCGC-AAA259I09]|uniref:Uncharacterized protein n=3 Tax=candidate division MSBL1 TaxID=215777 RepID=A0A133UPE3_9EURY|nr:hypothetical protein AKJ37_07340 [candidate division MSBL1 archaeon SCGC-AAA259I09]KXA96085.1 hypothetical protein AKJ38_03950 [candidate division MSBL1 archaeon SCGC-AAA259I14]KXA96413.1 hypothetical protein AKJ39_04645 [candidate division MSBL1 archaeon SCGC-AAA259J03]
MAEKNEKKDDSNKKWHPLVEKFSPRERIQLLNVLTEDIYQKSIAEACDVTPSAVSNWARRNDYCPSNKSAFYLLKLGQLVNPEKTAEIVKNGIEKYMNELEKIGIDIRKNLK